ncbi:MAG: hypothetical protein GKS02_07785 [Alphaproteobacteria bacterium]|nr:hypothetical protein [Alphaproteobacteria bacterium]
MRTRYFIIAAACLLTACAGAQNRQAPAQADAPAPLDVAPSQSSAVPPTPPQTTTPTPPAVAQPAPVREPVRAAPKPIPAPETLIGLAPHAVDTRLGEPDIVRLDGPAEIRLYRSAEANCTFHVFLYVKDGAGQSRAVEYYEARKPGGRLAGADLTDCYRALVTAS